jgi:hypothetical protein
MFFGPFQLAESLRESFPEINRRIGSPGPYFFQIKTRMKLDYPSKNQVGLRECVGIADGSKADAFGRPGAKALGFKQRSPKRHRVLSFRKRDRSAQHPPAEIANSFFASRRCLDLTEIGVCQDFRARK